MKKKLDWSRLKTPSDWVAFVISTVGGIGLIPRAPGTFGTIAAVPMVFYTLPLEWTTRITIWIFLLAAGTWAAAHHTQRLKTSDHPSIVIDEVLGFGLATWICSPALAEGDSSSLLEFASAFILFRFFDIAKLPPVHQLDRWSKKTTGFWTRGFGVIADDLVAGVQVLAVVMILQALMIFQ